MAKDGKGPLYTQAEVDRLIRQAVAPLHEKIVELKAKIARLTRDSRTSSKPPSSDVVKPKGKRGGGGKRKPGGQKGHAKHERALFPPDQVDEAYEYELTDTTGLRPLTGEKGWRIVQQIELVDQPYRIVEHRARRYVKVSTGRIVTAPLPQDVRRGGLLGPRLTGWIAYLKGPCHLSYRSVGLFFTEVMGLTLSVGVLAKAVAKTAEALAEPYEELLAVLPRQPVLGIDETGHRHRGQGCWTWCLHAPPGAGIEGLTCFVIDPSRGSNVVKELVGEDYAGIIVCDYFSAYRKCLTDMPDLAVQFCWAHLVRDVKFLAEHPDPATRRYGLKVLTPVRKLFKLLARRASMTAAGYRRALERLRRAVRHAIRYAPHRPDCWNLAERFRKHGDSYFTFIDHAEVPGLAAVEPTNNRTEQKIRFVVIDRKVTQGTKGEVGWQWCQRIWSTIATCRQRGINVYHFLLDAIKARLHKRPAPSLLST